MRSRVQPPGAESLAREWAVRAVALRLLEETRSRYERERQPEVIRAAEGHFERITGGRYARIVAPPGDSSVRVETEAPASEHARLTERLQHEIVDKRPSFRDFIKKGTVWPLVVELKSIGTIPRNPRTGKLMRVVDAL